MKDGTSLGIRDILKTEEKDIQEKGRREIHAQTKETTGKEVL